MNIHFDHLIFGEDLSLLPAEKKKDKLMKHHLRVDLGIKVHYAN